MNHDVILVGSGFGRAESRAAIADTPAGGVVDHRGETFGCPGLYFADGAVYPAPPGTPPSLTIAALAERQAEVLAYELGGG